MPGQVVNLTCPYNSSDGGALNIVWEQSSMNSGSINDYIVEVEEYFLQPENQALDSQPLDPPFRSVVQSNGVLIAAVSGVGELVDFTKKA